MAIDFHGLHFLLLVKNKKVFDATITIGRQRIRFTESIANSVIGNEYGHKSEIFCEKLFAEYFGASKIDSIDNSEFEGATIIHDMNKMIPDRLFKQFDTVIDGGSLEHIYNAPQALKNCSSLLKPGGQIIHILPANNFCGHGFWQFSPELFFSLYSEKNGYEGTEIFLADLKDKRHWYKVNQPEFGMRLKVKLSNRLYVLVRTTLKSDDFNHDDVQQSDYVYHWENSLIVDSNTTAQKHLQSKSLSKQNLIFKILSRGLFKLLIHRLRKMMRRKRDLTKIKIKSLLQYN